MSRQIKIGDGDRFDVTKVSQEGLNLDEIKRKKSKSIDIFKALDTNKDNKLDSLELAILLNGYNNVDYDDNTKLSKDEFDALARSFNNIYHLESDDSVSGKDMKKFLKLLRRKTKKDEKVSTNDVLMEEHKRLMEETGVHDYETKTEETKTEQTKTEVTKTEVTKKEEPELKQEDKAVEKETDVTTPKKYTVQEGESFRALIKRSLNAQGNANPTKEDMDAAIAEFKKNNPGALHKSKKGVEYLYAGAEVKIAGNLEDKANSKEIEARILERRKAQKKNTQVNKTDKTKSAVATAKTGETGDDGKIKKEAEITSTSKTDLNNKAVNLKDIKFDTNNNSINPKGYKRMSDGSIKKSLDVTKANESIPERYKKNPNTRIISADVVYNFYTDGRVKSLTVIETRPNGDTSTSEIHYDDKVFDNKGGRKYVRASGAYFMLNERYGIDPFYPDKLPQ